MVENAHISTMIELLNWASSQHILAFCGDGNRVNHFTSVEYSSNNRSEVINSILSILQARSNTIYRINSVRMLFVLITTMLHDCKPFMVETLIRKINH